MRKSVYTFLLLLLCFMFISQPAFVFAEKEVGQENAFRIIRQADSSGKIGLTHVFPIASKQLETAGFNAQEIKTYRFYLSTYVNALAKQNKDKNIQGVQVSSCTYFTDVDGLGFSIVFENIDAQKRFFGVEQEEESEEKTSSNIQSSGFFIKKLQMQALFPVSSEKAAKDLQAICKMSISSWCKDDNLSQEKQAAALSIVDDAVFIYDFATTQKDLKSEVMYDDEVYHHNVFVKTLEEIQEDASITFFTTYPNTPVWYASALVIVIVAMCVAYVILSRKKTLKSVNPTR